MAQSAGHRHRGPSAFPVFSGGSSSKKHPNRNPTEDRLLIRGLAELPVGFNGACCNRTSDHHANQSTTQGNVRANLRNSSAPKDRLISSEAALHNDERRANSMRITSDFGSSTLDGLCLEWMENGNSSLDRANPPNSQPARRSVTLRDFFGKGSSPGGKETAAAASGKSSSAKGAFKYLNAKIVGGKLARALTKDKSSGEAEPSLSSGKGISYNQQDHGREENAPGRNRSRSKTRMSKNNIDAARNSFSPRESVGEEHYTNIYLEDKVVLPTATHEKLYQADRSREQEPENPSMVEGLPAVLKFRDISESYFKSQGGLEGKQMKYELDPLEVVSKRMQEQAAMQGSFNELYDDADGALADKRDQLALEMASELRIRLAERATAHEALRRLSEEMDEKIRTLERDKAELQRRMQEQLEETEAGWISQVEKLKYREKRLSDRLREIAQEKVELQKEVSNLSSKKNALVEQVKESEVSVRTLKQKVEDSAQEISHLKNALAERCATKLSEDEYNTSARRNREVDKEVKEKQKTIGKLHRLCKEQEKTIQGLRLALGELATNAGKGEFLVKLQRELVRLTGIEQTLRKEVEVYKGDANATRKENANLEEKLGNIMHKLGGAAVRLADCDEDENTRCSINRHRQAATQSESENIHAGRGVLKSNHHTEKLTRVNGDSIPETNMALVAIVDAQNNYALSESLAGNQLMGDSPDSKFPSAGSLKSTSREVMEVEELHREVAMLTQARARLQKEADNLHSALFLTNRRVRELESQLGGKEKELEGVQEELGRVREQRDAIQKEADFMGREAMQLSAQVDKLSRTVEKLDEDVMMKEGQLSILRGAFDQTSD